MAIFSAPGVVAERSIGSGEDDIAVSGATMILEASPAGGLKN